MSSGEPPTSIWYHLIHTNICSIIYTRHENRSDILFLSQRYERNYALILTVEKDINHASTDAIHATHHNP